MAPAGRKLLIGNVDLLASCLMPRAPLLQCSEHWDQGGPDDLPLPCPYRGDQGECRSSTGMGEYTACVNVLQDDGLLYSLGFGDWMKMHGAART